MSDFETEVQAIGRALHARCAKRQPWLYRGLGGALLEQSMTDTRLGDALFQLVDVLPQLHDNTEVAAHLRAYLADLPLNGWTGKLLDLAARPRLAWSARRFVQRLARHFMAEESESGLARVLAELARVPAQASVDAVGEAVLTEAEADAYLARNLKLLEWLAHHGRPNISIKLTALAPRFDPLDATGTQMRIFARLAPLLEMARRLGATVTVDMESHELKAQILDLFLAICSDFPGDWQPTIALQAYLPETPHDLAQVLACAERLGRRLGVRLVKGAYWDQETAWAAQRGWPVPTLRDKAATDAQHERLAGWLIERTEALHPAIASHNLRSLSAALARARRRGLPMDGSRWELQMLYGMAEPLRDALAAAGAPLRIYVPTGELETGIAYLIRRLLENTSSTSVLRQTYIGELDAAVLLAPPVLAPPSAPEPSCLANLPLLDFSVAKEREQFSAVLRRLRAELPRRLASADFRGDRYIVRNPAQTEDVLGEVDLADAAAADLAVARARTAFAAWSATAAIERSRVLRHAAELIVERRRKLAALEVLEVAKPWREADADVAEAADFLRYYADEMEHLAGWRTTVNFPGESNCVAHAPRGVAAIIAPWNFPLAILTGMTAAALVAGNTAIMKPALPALLLAHELRDILHAAGVPPDAVQLLPGDAAVGAALVGHADVHIIAFTGSQEVGTAIYAVAAQRVPGARQLKRVVAEMGGKNAIIVDDLIATGSSLLEAAEALRKAKATTIVAAITHGVLSGPAIERVQKCAALEKLLITDSIPLAADKASRKIEVLSVAGLLGEAIKRIHNEESVSSLFD